MAVTGAIFNSLVFGGVNSADYGIYITGEAVFNAPKRAVETVSVPGRNGDIIIDQGHWENIEVTYPAGTFGMNETEFRTALSDFRNAIVSQLGYQRLSDTYHPDEYRMGTYVEGLEVDTKSHNKAGQFNLVFNCKPQRWLTSGEIPVTIGEWGETETVSGEIVEIDNPNGIESVKSLKVSLEPIQDLNGYDKPWVGGAGKNKANIDDSENGGIDSNGNNVVYAYNWRSISLIPIQSGQAYTLHAVGMAITRLYFYDTDGNFISPRVASQTDTVTATAPSNAKYVKWTIYKTGITIADVQSAKVQLEQGSSATSFEPYSNICPISGRTEVNTQITGKNLIDPSGVTNEALDSEGEAIPSTVDALTDFIELLPNTDYTFRVSTNNRGGSVGVYDKDKNFLGFRYIPIEDGAEYAGADFNTGNNIKYGRAVYSSNATDAILCVGTDYSVTYVPYVAPHEYHTDLGRTVYGGTLDVVSGVLTVDKEILTFDSNNANLWSGVATSRQGVTRAYTVPSYTNRSVVCSDSYEAEGDYITTIGIATILSSGRLIVTPPFVQGKTLEEFKTALADHPFSVVLTLATPQTYQLTPQQVTLLLGENHVWSDGSITMQYGDDPNSLWNPTLYESHPLLMVEGYGGLRFGENRFYLRSATYGDVELIDEQTFDLSRNNSYTFELPSYKYQAGDTITVEPFVAKFRVYDKSGQVRNMTATTTSGPATVTIGGGNTRVLVNVAFDGTIPLTFTAGTTKSYTEDITLVYTNSAGSRPRVTANITILYNSADETITISSEFTTPSSAVIYAEDTEFNGITADSTATVIGEVTYIDCELGEAYKIENGKLLPVSYYLTMTPAKPALIPGDNEITITSDTITGLSIIPRWWQL